MNKEELELLLVDVSAPISAIEKRIGIPKNVLQQSLKGKRNLPKEWSIKLKSFVEKKQYIGLKRKKTEEKVVVAVPETKEEKKPLSFHQQLLNKKMGIK